MAERQPKLLVVFGTRPEAIKMAPLVLALKNTGRYNVRVCVTAQHREMLDQVLAFFGIVPDVDLDLMRPGQDLFVITIRALEGLREAYGQEQPDLVLLHGDTTTTLAGALAAYYMQIPTGHVEAGLRTYDFANPFPEELNRVTCDHLATLHFAPTTTSEQNLLKLGIKPDGIHVTGNTVIDALHETLHRVDTEEVPPLPVTLSPGKRLVLVTVHRRENFGEPLARIVDALRQLITRHPDIELVLPVHPNPNVAPIVREALGDLPRVKLVEPMDYVPFCQLMNAATLVITDSGGVQEEAPALGKPVLVMREETERPEAVTMGTVALVGTDTERIVEEASRLLEDPRAYGEMANAVNPYGDGRACTRIVGALDHYFGFNELPPEAFTTAPVMVNPGVAP